MIELIIAGVSAAAQISAGKAAKEAADLDAFNIDTQKVLSKTEAVTRHNQRLEQYRYNTKANIAAFAATGRDVGSDRSVAAFLERQKQVATQDTARSDLMGYFEMMKMQQQATATRIEGRARQQAATIAAFTTMAQGIADYKDTGGGRGGGGGGR